MNLKLEDLTHYLIIIIFLLIIIKVLGAGLYATFIEFMTGHKQEDNFELDDLISSKKSQMNFQNPQTNLDESKSSLKLKVENSSHPAKLELLEILKTIQWGDYDQCYAKKSAIFLENTSSTSGLVLILDHFFKESFKEDREDMISNWTRIFENSILWTNLLNQTKTNQFISTFSKMNSLQSVALIFHNDIEKVQTLNEEELRRVLETFYQPINIENLVFNNCKFPDVKTEEIYELWQKNAHIFKSLQPIVPTRVKKTKSWAKEILNLPDDEYTSAEVREKYLFLSTTLHPDKFAYLSLSEKNIKTLGDNFALINAAYDVLKT
ncbi:hypothetical protein A9Q84_09925 [Halobacteriovorax marinus]|uniref:J domain-containing protein n=1 Tax=Halobacteriovorax marinus TaxID=97084 RepID=A0A1Y5FDH7_9BACT|nr:hypothetical protein A9Q84_09925 [Halobacteriovorax marinus]